MHYNPNMPGDKILIGALGDQLIGVSDNRHALTFGGTRSGKSVTVIGNLLFYQGSVFVLDPKGELATKTAIARSKSGQDVVVLDPFNQVEGDAQEFRSSYNPLQVLSLDDPSVIEKAIEIAEANVMRNDSEKDPHWNETASATLLGFILYAAFGDDLGEDERNLLTVRQCVAKARHAEMRGKAKVYTLPNKVKAAIQWLFDDGHEDVANAILNSVTAFYDKSNEEMAGVASTMNRHTAYIDFISMKAVLRDGALNLRDLKKRKVTVYVCLPVNRLNSCRRWMRMMTSQLIEAIEEEKIKNEIPVLAVLDEFAVLGFMANLQVAVGLVAGLGMKIWFILQDYAQGEAIYGKRWPSFLANCGVVQGFSMNDEPTTEYFSKRLGKTPVQTNRNSDAAQDQAERGASGKSQSIEMFDLMTPDEISRYFNRDDKMKRQLVLVSGYHPMILERVEYYDSASPLSQYVDAQVNSA